MAAHRDFDFQSRWAVTVDELMHHLNALQPTVIHFSGHGVAPRAPDGGSGARRDADPARYAGESGIYLENDHREAQLVTGGALTRMIRSTAVSVRLVVLNACYSDEQAGAMCEAVDCVVGMGGAIADDTARAFAVSFYRALGHRRSVANAVEQAAATIAGKRLPGDQLPHCRTRDGVDADRVILSGPAVRSPSWTARLDAMLRLSREAHEKLTSDPFGTAARSQQALGHLVDYLHERELGAADLRATLEAKLKRIEAKQVVPSMVASHFGSVLAYTSLVLHGGEDELSPAEPGLLQPCLGSLVVAFRWFFREYLKQAVPELGWELGYAGLERSQIPDATPVNSTMRTKLSTGTRFGTGIGEVMPVWRTRPATSRRVTSSESPRRSRLLGTRADR